MGEDVPFGGGRDDEDVPFGGGRDEEDVPSGGGEGCGRCSICHIPIEPNSHFLACQGINRNSQSFGLLK